MKPPEPYHPETNPRTSKKNLGRYNRKSRPGKPPETSWPTKKENQQNPTHLRQSDPIHIQCRNPSPGIRRAILPAFPTTTDPTRNISHHHHTTLITPTRRRNHHRSRRCAHRNQIPQRQSPGTRRYPKLRPQTTPPPHPIIQRITNIYNASQTSTTHSSNSDIFRTPGRRPK